MKTIKSILIIAAVLLSNAIIAQPPGGGQRGSQQGPPPIPNEKQIKEMIGHLAQEVSLSKEQKEKMEALYVEHFKLVKEKMSTNKRPKKEEMETLKTEFEKSLKALLNKDQIKKFEAFHKKMRPQHKKAENKLQQ